MQVARPDGGKLLAESIIAWWQDAGVDYLCEEAPISWLERAASPDRSLTRPATIPARGAPEPPTAAPARPGHEWPKDFAGMMTAIASDAGLPGNGYGRQIAAPVAVENAQLMVVCDYPDDAELESGQLGLGATGALLRAMLVACGYDPRQVHIAALAHSRPASGALPPGDAAALADFARHHIGIVRPERLLFLGTAVSEILAGKELMEARAGLPDFNQDGRSMASVATFHPRTLIARPILKRQAWQDLQAIVKKDCL